jgi:hypothetical protein
MLPILTRMTIATDEQPIRIDRAIESRGGFQLAHGVGPAGDVNRVYMLMWSEVFGTAGRVFPPLPPGELARAGSIFAEHVFTRPFGPKDQHRVVELDAPGLPRVPPDRYDAAPATTGMDAPAGARWLDDLAPDPSESCFTLDQTDSNQHVNSLVYIRIFVDAVQRRLAAAGQPLRVRTRALDIAYRKPCFAGDRVRAHVRRFACDDGTLGAAGYLATDGDAKPRCYVRITVGP